MNIKTSGKVVHGGFMEKGYWRTMCGYSERDSSQFWKEMEEPITCKKKACAEVARLRREQWHEEVD